MFKYLRLCAFLLLTTMVIYSCGGNKSGDNAPANPLTLNAAKIVAVKSDNTFQIEGSVFGVLAGADNFTFTSDNDSSASVDENGLVTVKENNDATITVALKSDPTITASLQVEKHSFETFYTDDSAESVFAIDSKGDLYAWGGNDSGELGVGNFVHQTLPQKVTFPDGVKLSSMDNFIYYNKTTFALLDNGKFYAWGNNNAGELGVGSSEYRINLPTEVPLPATLSSMDNFAIDGNSSFALLDNGLFYAWGGNNIGQLGVGDTANKPSPTEIALPAKLSSMDNFTSKGSSTFALLNDGLFYAWGYNDVGQLGVGDTVNKPSPTPVAFSGGSGKLLSMDNFTISEQGSAFALLDDGSFYAWGANEFGQLGVNSPNNSEPSPKPVTFTGGAKLLSMDNFTFIDNSAFALLNDGSFYAWGYNSYGELGVGDSNETLSPKLVAFTGGAKLSSMDNLTSDGDSSFALLNDGSFYAWGSNNVGQLGVGSPNMSEPSPIEVILPAKLSSMDNLTYKGSSSFALLDNGLFYAWGSNNVGQLGVGDTTNKPSPTEIALPATLLSMKNFTYKGSSSFALLNDGKFYAWGKNDKGKLGVGGTDNALSPAKVLIPDDEKLLSYDKFINGYANTLFITGKGFLYSMGNGYYGQLGNGSTDNQNTPQNVW